MYRFYITIGATQTLVTPLGFNQTRLVSEKERDQVFYRTRFEGVLVFNASDYELIWTVEQSDPCERITLLIEKHDGTTWVTYFEGYFSSSDGDFDLDRCTFTVTPLTDDKYDVWFTGGNREYNILDTTFIPTVITTTASDRVYDRNRLLSDVIEALAAEVNPLVNVISTFFTNENNPATLQPNDLRYLTIAQKSDIKRWDSTNPATVALLSFNELMDILRTMFNVYWDIDGNDLIIEHISYYTGVAGMDLRTAPLSEATNKYRYKKEDIPMFEKYNFMEAFNNDFIGVPIFYDSLCANQDSDNNLREYSVRVSTDLDFIDSDPDAISDQGFVLLSNYLDGTDYLVSFGYSILTTGVLFNVQLSWAYLQNNYFRHNRALQQGYINRNLVTFFSSQKNKLQELNAIICEDFDPAHYLLTPLGDILGENAYIDRAEVRPSGETVFALVYGPEPSAPSPIPSTLVLWIRLTATHITVDLSRPSSSDVVFWMRLDGTTCQQVIIHAPNVNYTSTLDDALPAEFNFTDIGLGTEVYLNDGDAIVLTVACPAVPVAPSVVINSISTIDNGEEFDKMNVSLNYTNSGGDGSATVEWRIKDSGGNVIESDDNSIYFVAGTGNVALTGLLYPAAGNGYTLEAKITTQASYVVSNAFNSTPM